MYPDPGWGSAAKYGFLALVSRGRSLKIRPAITAARAGTLGFLYSAVAMAEAITKNSVGAT